MSRTHNKIRILCRFIVVFTILSVCAPARPVYAGFGDDIKNFFVGVASGASDVAGELPLVGTALKSAERATEEVADAFIKSATKAITTITKVVTDTVKKIVEVAGKALIIIIIVITALICLPIILFLSKKASKDVGIIREQNKRADVSVQEANVEVQEAKARAALARQKAVMTEIQTNKMIEQLEGTGGKSNSGKDASQPVAVKF